MRTLILLVTALAITTAARTSDACQRSEPPSPLTEIYNKKFVLYVEVQRTENGYWLRSHDTFKGTSPPDEVHVGWSDCMTLEVGQYYVIGFDDPANIPGMFYPLAEWPAEPENQALITAFAKAKDDAAIAKLLVTHAHKGWASYVDFPMIARFLAKTPAIVDEMSKAQAKQLLADLNHHPRARKDAAAALRKRAT